MFKKMFLLTALAASLAACPGATVPPGPQPSPQPIPKPTPTSVGTPIGKPVDATIGAAGGTLASADGAVQLEIPAGAITTDQTISIQEITNNAPGAFGKAFRLTPEGTTFAKPVKLSFVLTEDQAQGATLEAINVAYQKDGYWKPVAVVNRDTASRTVTVETTHLSDWSVVPGAQLTPLHAHIKEGETLQLEVMLCGESPTEGPYGDAFGCQTNIVASHVARNWSVNGQTGGNAVVGTVTNDAPGIAVYTAPATKPRPHIVAVSTQISALDGGRLTLVANVMIGDEDADWKGTITYKESGARSWPARDNFTGSFTGTYSQNRTFTVVGVKSVEGPSTTLILKQVADSDYTFSGSKHREIYEICQALGPVVLRYYDHYEINSGLKGTLENTLEARLYRDADGGYSMFVAPGYIAVAGKEIVTSIHKDGCSQTTTDDSYTKDKSSSVGVPHDIGAVGTGPDPKNKNHYSGNYTGKGGQWSVETDYAVKWDLTRLPKP